MGNQMSRKFSILWKILTKAAADPKAGEIVCILDALDKCEEPQQIAVITRLKDYHSHTKGCDTINGGLRFLVTSRPYWNIRTQLHSITRDFPTVYLAGDHESDLIKEEIDLVIKAQISAIAQKGASVVTPKDFCLIIY